MPKGAASRLLMGLILIVGVGSVSYLAGTSAGGGSPDQEGGTNIASGGALDTSEWRMPSKASVPAGPSPIAEADRKGIFKLDHLIFIVMENRSFDHYFGTYPGVDGIPRKVCVPDPEYDDRCAKPYHSTELVNFGGPHGRPASVMDVNDGKMDGFIRSLRLSPFFPCIESPEAPGCDHAFGPQGQPEVMSYHTRNEIPNYWRYADEFVLQDRMFAPVDSWTLPSHLFLVSGWSAMCKNDDPMSCTNDSLMRGGMDALPHREHPYAWTDITYLLNARGVDWRWYNAPDSCGLRECEDDEPKLTAGTLPAMNPLPGFVTVSENRELDHIQSYPAFFRDAASGDLAPVTWIAPGYRHSDHPATGAPLTAAQQFVTEVVNAIGEGPDWDRSAIFITWDDWGGYYDHVRPPRVDRNGYGLRVPGLLISPYAKRGYVDSQTLSFDAYLKLIEDRFLGGQRLDPENDGRPDPRPTVREDVEILGDLSKAFDFRQPPREPLFLDPTPGDA